MTTLSCPVCPRRSWLTVDGLAHHLERDHSPAVIAETLARISVTVATAREKRTADCPTGKIRYSSEHEARTELIGTIIGRNRGKERRQECRAYECTSCAGWHLTSMHAAPVKAAP